tara:strand:+ start:145 stop:501 length:357 start_codon:yes stop_codon:yes gene_type:complete
MRFTRYDALQSEPWVKVIPDKPIEDLSDEELTNIVNNAGSISVFIGDEDKAEIPAIVAQMQTLRDNLKWRGEVKDSPSAYVDKRSGEEVVGYRIGFTKEPPRNPSLGAFSKRIAKLVR